MGTIKTWQERQFEHFSTEVFSMRDDSEFMELEITELRAALASQAESAPVAIDRAAAHRKALAMQGEAPHCIGPLPDLPEVKESGQVYGIIDPDYGRIYTMVRKLAWEEGYAIGLHGSFTRDLDMIAVPWEDGRNCKPEKLIARIVQATGMREAQGKPGEKPHGRKVWTLLMPEFGDPRFVDLSIVATSAAGVPHIERDAALPAAVVAWHAAEKARIEAVGKYNGKLAAAKEYGFPGPDMSAEYKAMTDAGNAAHRLLLPMYEAIAAMPAQQGEKP